MKTAGSNRMKGREGEAAEAGHGFFTTGFLRTVPRQPGVYLMRDDAGRIIYVGKALDLRKRLASYGRVAAGHGKTAIMVGRVRTVETIITATEKEALILESSLIKQHKPRYNIILRDDKSYPFLKLTVNETWPRLLMSRRRQKDGARYFGPFSSASAMWETLNYLQGLFPLRRCRERDLRPRARPCLNYQMQRCLAPCSGKADPVAYGEMVAQVIMVLEGRDRQLVRELENRMNQAAAALNFEEAALCRDRLAAIAQTLEKQVMVSSRFSEQDVFGFARRDLAVAMSVVLVRNGRVSGHQFFLLEEPLGSDAEVLAEFLARYYGDERPVPAEILLPFVLSAQEVLVEWLTDLRGGRVACRVPQRGEGVRLLSFAENNAGQFLADRLQKQETWEELAASIRDALRLERIPRRIECLDISNIGGEQAVGSLVSFLNGEKHGAGYRHYKIRTVTGADDYAMMAEVLQRRFRDAGGPPSDELPDLLVVDGGKGQLNTAVQVVTELGLAGRLELAGLAKDRHGAGERIFLPGRKNAVALRGHSPVLLLFMRIRDEAHRFGITFHRKWRNRQTLSSALDDLPGIGPARRQALLSSLGSLRQIKQATAQELAAVPGIGPELAATIWQHFHGQVS